MRSNVQSPWRQAAASGLSFFLLAWLGVLVRYAMLYGDFPSVPLSAWQKGLLAATEMAGLAVVVTLLYWWIENRKRTRSQSNDKPE